MEPLSIVFEVLMLLNVNIENMLQLFNPDWHLIFLNPRNLKNRRRAFSSAPEGALKSSFQEKERGGGGDSGELERCRHAKEQ